MERSQVTNGCSGACCEKFTLPITINDLHAMKASYNQQRLLIAANPAYTDRAEAVVLEDGRHMFPELEDDVDKLLDMLIPLGITSSDPQDCKDIGEQLRYNPEIHSDELVRNHSRGHVLVMDGKLISRIFTCKHFDAVNRICLNYENRPRLCQNFGDKCRYVGCGYPEKIIKNISNKEAIAQ